MSAISLARSGGQSIRLYDDARSTHMHVMGASGQGKSFFLEHLIREDVIRGRGVCVIDPHGELYSNVLNWLVSEGWSRVKTIHLLNPSDPTYTFGFNPLVVDNGTPIGYRVDAMVDACLKVWGGTDLTQTPRLAKCLRAVFHVLAEHKLSLAEARFLIFRQHRDEALQLTSTLTNPEYRAVWEDLLDAGGREFREYLDSTVSRLLAFVGDETIKDIVGQTENVIDFRRCMDKGHIVLVNLSRGGVISGEASRLLGALITNDLYTTAFARDLDRAKRRPFYCYIDECADYLTEDVVKSLDQTRKFGLHMVLSHQRLDQLRDYGDNFYNAVMAGAQLKVVFNPNDDDAAEVLSRHFFRTSFDLELPKRSMDKPFVVAYHVRWFESEAATTTEIHGSGTAAASGAGTMTGMSQLYDANGNAIGGQIVQDTSSSMQLDSSNRFSAGGESQSYGRSEGLEPELAVLPTELHKLDELIHLGMVELLRLQPRQAWVCSPTVAPMKITTYDVKPGTLLPEFVPARIARLNEASPVVSPRTEVRAGMKRRAEGVVASTNAVAFDPEDDGLGV
ncbi:MAG: type IV secretion system DNA-binding domain-containing protein [Silicimonas sp.]|jgi:hypothetical protein|uniref:type IV secretory system conjugative DNA transfer family protein n=1 Tax=Alphaproteobacteria TaxID=28211 RepID=UPI0032EF7A38